MRALLTLALLALPTLVAAGPLADAIGQDEANLYFSFQTREGVWGDGHSLNIDLEDGRHFRHYDGRDRSQLTEGPGRVWIRVRDGRVRDVDLEVGGPEPRMRSGTTDLGTIDPAEVREVMLSIAESATGGDVEGTIVCAIVTEGFDEWKRLIGIARDRDRPDDLRESAIFWLGQEASAITTAGLEQIVADDDEELELREHAIFSLSQQGLDQCFAALRKVALESRHPQLREQAFFWLAQHDDPRVIDLLEEVLVQ